VATRAYDASGGLTTTTHANTVVEQRTYDPRNLLICEQYPAGLATPKRSADAGAVLPVLGTPGNVELRANTYDPGRRQATLLDQAGCARRTPMTLPTAC
jgi:YD repeat-containing protein